MDDSARALTGSTELIWTDERGRWWGPRSLLEALDVPSGVGRARLDGVGTKRLVADVENDLEDEATAELDCERFVARARISAVRLALDDAVPVEVEAGA